MLLLVTGASGAGKSTVLSHLEERRWARPITTVEFDSIGVPPGADTSWRHGAVERWVQRAIAEQGNAIAEQGKGRHMVLFGQVPIGELLAAPSADQLDGIGVCVLHCTPESRRARLAARGEPAESVVHHVAFGEWFLAHASDPQHRPDVIRVESAVPMRWDRWEDWTRGDPRWQPTVIDTSALRPDEAAERVAAWVDGGLTGMPFRFTPED